MSQTFLAEIDEFIRARYPLLYVVTWEEDRARRLLAQVAEKQHKTLFEWSVTDGLRRLGGDTPRERGGSGKRERDALKVLNEILQADITAIYLLKDFHTYMEAPEIVRQLRDLGYALRRTHKTIIILSPTLKIPPELDKAVTIVDLPLPSYDELGDMLNRSISASRSSRQFSIKLTAEERDGLIKAAQGLTLTEAENAFAKAVVRDRTLDGQDLQAIVDEKKQVIRKSGLLEYCDVGESLKNVGGMDLLKDWLKKRLRAFGEEARDYGLPAPKGVLLMGIQGCGKSLVAKCIASSWRLPLLRMDMSRIFQGYIGSSEENMRRALQMAETLAPVVLWVDEIEKALSGVDGSSGTDGGTTARVVGQFLTWMQEKTGAVFVVATANRIKGLPPELIRKGRLDETFFVDLPRSRERAEILHIHLRKVKRDPAKFDLHALVDASNGFSGAEIEQAIVSGLHDSFFENRDLETQDVVQAMEETVPLSHMMREDIVKLRRWAAYRARPVSSLQPRRTKKTEPETESSQPGVDED